MQKLVDQVLEKLFELAEIEYCHEYGERGYEIDEGKKFILFADWNLFDDKYPNFMEYLDEHYMCEWSDEWIIDYSTDKCYRTVGDSYAWEQQYRITDFGEMITPDNDVEDWVEFCKIDDPKQTPHVLPSFIDHEEVIKLGFELIDEEYENGFYHRHDDPLKIAEELFDNGYDEVVFSLSGVEQFRINFQAFARKL